MGRKATALFVLCAFLLNAAGYLDVYHFMYRKDSGAYRQYLKKQQALQLTTTNGIEGLSKKGYKRKAKGEYVYKGKRFDVIKKVKKAGSTVIYLAHDSYEEELLGLLQSFFSSPAAKQENPRSARLKHDIVNQYLATARSYSPVFAAREITRPACFVRIPPSPFYEVVVPPPQLTG